MKNQAIRTPRPEPRYSRDPRIRLHPAKPFCRIRSSRPCCVRQRTWLHLSTKKDSNEMMANDDIILKRKIGNFGAVFLKLDVASLKKE